MVLPLENFIVKTERQFPNEDLPQHLVDALVATEDERFYNHSGIDARGTIESRF